MQDRKLAIKQTPDGGGGGKFVGKWNSPHGGKSVSGKMELFKCS